MGSDKRRISDDDIIGKMEARHTVSKRAQRLKANPHFPTLSDVGAPEELAALDASLKIAARERGIAPGVDGWMGELLATAKIDSAHAANDIPVVTPPSDNGWLRPKDYIPMVQLGDKTDQQKRKMCAKLAKSLPEKDKRAHGRETQVRLTAWQKVCDQLNSTAKFRDDCSEDDASVTKKMQQAEIQSTIRDEKRRTGR